MRLNINAKFRPFTYEEMVKPISDYMEAYNKAEKEYTELITNTEEWENRLKGAGSEKAYERYKDYYGALSPIVEDFSNGMNLNNRKALLEMKRGFYKTIKPISEAYAKKEQLMKERTELKARDPMMVFDKSSDQISIDNLIDNPAGDYNRNVSGSAVYKAVQSGAQALAKEFRDSPARREQLRQIAGGDYYEYIKRRGFRADDVLKAVRGDANAASELTELVDNAVKSTGITKWNNNEATEELKGWGRQALWDAVGADDSQILDNWRRKADYSAAKELETYEGKKIIDGLHGGGNGGGINGRLNIVPYGRLAWKTIDVPLYKDLTANAVTTEEYNKQGKKNKLIPGQRKIIEKQKTLSVIDKSKINEYAKGISPAYIDRVWTPKAFLKERRGIAIKRGESMQFVMSAQEIVDNLSSLPSIGPVHGNNFLIVQSKDGHLYAAPSNDPYLRSIARGISDNTYIPEDLIPADNGNTDAGSENDGGTGSSPEPKPDGEGEDVPTEEPEPADDEQIKQLNDSIDALNEDNEDLQNKVNTLQNDNNDWIEKYNRQLISRDSLERVIKQNNEEMNRLKREVAANKAAREEAERKLREATKGKPGDVQKPPVNNGGGGNPGTSKPKNRLDGGSNKNRVYRF